MKCYRALPENPAVRHDAQCLAQKAGEPMLAGARAERQRLGRSESKRCRRPGTKKLAQQCQATIMLDAFHKLMGDIWTFKPHDALFSTTKA